MCDDHLGCQLQTPYFGFRLSASGSLLGAFGEYEEDKKASGSVAGGAEGAFTVRWANSDSPQDGSFEGLGLNFGYDGEWTTRDSFRHMPFATFEIWTHDAQVVAYLGAAYSLERLEDADRHGGRLMFGALWKPFTSPMQNDQVNPLFGGDIFLGGEGGDGQGGFVLGLHALLGVEFFPLF